ncbi:hypothetical protein QFZ75_008014 [Streptomyces sp. V3I8]|uniref:hypothetical protein n=1 Tax=Streptomyces sp. V3I8 TaxID=3042279 RepID=UPI0027823D19|nr:hypothetical protein [Streptomyces sp. V3I8]MDQ1041512.1 hypothetical protein [Streptomyces sp. V3I8]
MSVRQSYPSPGLAPDFHWDLQGRAQFRHKGFTVRVLIRPATDDDGVYYLGTEPGANDVVLVGTVDLDHVEVASVGHGADFTNPYQMNEALRTVLDDAVSDARTNVGRLVKALAAVDAQQEKEAKR